MNAQETLLAQYVALYPDDAARLIDQLRADDIARVLEGMDVRTAAMLAPHLAASQAARGIAGMEPGRAAAVLAGLPPDIAAALLRRLDPAAAAELLDALPGDNQPAVRALLTYPADSAGGVMDPLVLTAPLSASVKETQALVSGHPGHLYYYVYVLDAAHHLAGVVDIAELLQADPDRPLEAVMHTNVLWLAADSSLDAIFVHPGWRLYDAMPVLGPDRRFLGVIRHRRMRQLLEARQGGATARPAVSTVMALGEIYWVGLCGLLQGIAAVATESHAGGSAR